MWALAAVCASCGRRVSPEDLAAQTAKNYYDMLIRGRYADFVDVHYQPDSIPSSYRDQLIANAEMFMEQQRQEHGGLKEVRTLGSEADTLHHKGQAFLLFVYGDKSSERVVVPLVWQRGVWYLQ